ncbi:MAG: sel1 repeat family protein [Rhodospirillaceae bacterium]|nr:sel1 repeat family protein [Rhodospirillaceae bacterium]
MPNLVHIYRLAAILIGLLPAVLAPVVWAQGDIRRQMLMEQAEAGDAEAQFALGASYASGLAGGFENRLEAIRWYRKAAEQGLAMAQKNLAQLFAERARRPSHFIKAYKWYEIAIPKMADQMVVMLLGIEQDNLAKKMTLADVAKAKKLAEDWTRDYKARTGQVDAPAAEAEWTCTKRSIDGPTPLRRLNPCLLNLPKGKWIRIHRQKKTDSVRFGFQPHGGAAFDTKRGRLVLIGSDTHSDHSYQSGGDWINGPHLFDVARLRWMRFYRNDSIVTYEVNRWGAPVAGYNGDRPWPMHTYGAVTYHPGRDEVVVSSHPAHLAPEKFIDVLADKWRRIKHHPTWILSFRSNRWSTLRARPQSFFLHSTTLDSDRNSIIGYRSDGVFELGGNPRKWRRILRKGLLGHHSNSVYDSKHKVVVVFGNRPVANSVVQYSPATRTQRRMPTPGLRPPKDRHAPMAFHGAIQKTVVLVDQVPEWAKEDRSSQTTGTWLYDAGKDSWERVESAQLPMNLGMNYNLVYDSAHNLLLVVAAGRGYHPTIWALRL